MALTRLVDGLPEFAQSPSSHAQVHEAVLSTPSPYEIASIEVPELVTVSPVDDKPSSPTSPGEVASGACCWTSPDSFCIPGGGAIQRR